MFICIRSCHSELLKMSSSNKDFIEEKIKEKPVNKKKFFINLVLVLIIAAAAAVVAAFVFVNMIPVAKKISGKEDPKSKISITSEEPSGTESSETTNTENVPSVSKPADNEQSESQPSEKEASKSETAETGSPENEPGESAEKDPSGTPTPEPGAEVSPEPDNEKKEEASGTDSKSSDNKDEEDKSDQVTEIVREEIIYKELTIDDYITLHGKMSEIAGKAQQSIVYVTGITSMMDYFENTYENSQTITGVIIADTDDEIYILTGYRALDKVERIQVTFHDGYISDAFFLRNDPDTGLAVIKVNKSGLPEETMGSIRAARFSTLNNTKAGDRIMVLGTILGHSHSIDYGTVISTSDKYPASDCEYDLISTDIGSVGSTSGVILNLRGSITGIIVPADKRGQDSSLSAFTSEGIKELIEALSNNESRPYLGIRGMDVTDSIAERSGVAKGILITAIENDSPAMLAGIMENDILVKIGDTSVMTVAEYDTALKEYSPGEAIKIVVMRMGNEGYTEVEFNVTVGEI